MLQRLFIQMDHEQKKSFLAQKCIPKAKYCLFWARSVSFRITTFIFPQTRLQYQSCYLKKTSEFQLETQILESINYLMIS